VVDDGSADATSAIAAEAGAVVVRQPLNRGLAAARNAGVLAASGDVVAFLDDDCEPAANWSRSLLAAYDEHALGVGGPIVASAPDTAFGRFVVRNNPLGPLEAELGPGDPLAHRLRLYLRRQRRGPGVARRYATPALVGANMSFRRSALLEAGLFDPAFTFGAEDIELGFRITDGAGRGRLVFDPGPRVTHHFKGTPQDSLRRSHSYGLGTARLFWRRRSLVPAVYPLPVLLLALLAGARRHPRLLVLVALVPQAWFPRAAVHALGDRRPEALGDPYLKAALEMAANIGVVRGLVRGAPEPRGDAR
jgi:glycosyltransferase involved in cell wall biosynthesis